MDAKARDVPAEIEIFRPILTLFLAEFGQNDTIPPEFATWHRELLCGCRYID
jgi:hypothetical protein